MLEWASENPWSTFFMVIIGITIVENVVKRKINCNDSEISDYLSRLSKADYLKQSLQSTIDSKT